MPAWIESLFWMFGAPICWARRKHAWGAGPEGASNMELFLLPPGVPPITISRRCRVCRHVEFKENPDFREWSKALKARQESEA